MLVDVVSLRVSYLVLHVLLDVVVQSPLPKDWQGYSVKFAESLKGTYERDLLCFGCVMVVSFSFLSDSRMFFVC